MTPTEISEQLDAIAADPDFVAAAYELTDAWEHSGVGVEALEPVLRFMEGHPDIDLGNPGPLVHFVERFLGPGYEASLLASLRRQPVAHTAWMLNRLINVAPTPIERGRLMSAMVAARQNARTDKETLDRIDDYLDFQKSKRPAS